MNTKVSELYLYDRAHDILVKNPTMKKSIEEALLKQANISALGKPSTVSSVANKIKSLKPKNPLTQAPKYTKAHTTIVPTPDHGASLKSAPVPTART